MNGDRSPLPAGVRAAVRLGLEAAHGSSQSLARPGLYQTKLRMRGGGPPINTPPRTGVRPPLLFCSQILGMTNSGRPPPSVWWGSAIPPSSLFVPVKPCTRLIRRLLRRAGARSQARSPTLLPKSIQDGTKVLKKKYTNRIRHIF